MGSELSQDKIYSVSEITREIKSVLEDEFRSIWVEGEISNYIHHSSGHRYFTLKDSSAQIRAVIWRFSARGLKLEPRDGLQVRVFGDVTLYERQGNYQLRVTRIEEVGTGSLQQQFERLKTKLNTEGLFDPERKCPIPQFPDAIGIVTSPTGAAVRDIINICRRRAPTVRLVVRPTQVQGDSAAEDIVAAINEFNEWGDVDLLIVGRGGGSLEDLWAFNEEIVARAIAESSLPVISAVGHETDFTISDFVADLRAPTPSAAAELATFDSASISYFLGESRSRLVRSLSRQSKQLQERLKRVLESRIFTRPESLIEPPWQRLDQLQSRLNDMIADHLNRQNNRLILLSEKLGTLSPDSVLKRGYSIVRRCDDLSIIKDASAVSTNDRVEINFSKGKRTAVIE